MLEIIKKIRRKLWGKVVSKTRNHKIYPCIYRSYWKYKLTETNLIGQSTSNYYSAVPNVGAGIGHQMANWIAGYLLAKKFNLKFAHIPFSSSKWEDFLGFGNDEILVDELTKKRGYKRVLLPLFNENNAHEVAMNEKIIAAHKNEKVVFIAEQDQFYRNQFEVCSDIKLKFYGSRSRRLDKIIYNKDYFNIAIHIRRGDIVLHKDTNPNLKLRFQDDTYFEQVLTHVLTHLDTPKPVAIYLFSQGEVGDFENLKNFKNLTFCLEFGPLESFLHLTSADLLVTSKSSFSYKPALLSNGIKISPRSFWHSYPDDKDWILADEDGSFDTRKLKNVVNVTSAH
jgi:hypothetical protein